VYVDYSNTGTVAIPAPLLVLTASQGSSQGAFLSLDSSLAGLAYNSNATPAGFSPTVQFLASGATPGMLEPGESIQIPVYYAGWLSAQWSGAPVTFSLREATADNTQPIDWPSVAPGLQLGSINDNAWSAISPILAANMGSTWGQYVQTLDSDAAYLAGIGQPTTDISQLLSFEVEKANAAYTAQTLVTVTADDLPAPGMDLTFVQSYQQPISGRYTQGILGFGWTTNWDISATTMANGDVVIDDDGISAYFSLQPNGSFAPEAGDKGSSLTASGGAYQLVGADGTILKFNPDGTLNYVQDTHGNTITAAYNPQGQLVSLTDSNGEYVDLAYNSAAHLASLTDSNGQTESYAYDVTGQFLISYTDVYGTTTYTYVTGQSAAQNNALAEIAYADNTHVYFEYDAEGRLIDQHRDGGQEDQTWTYLNPGGYTTADGDGNKTTVYFDRFGAAAVTIDPLGNVTRASYDSKLNLTKVIGPGGATHTYTYDANGNLTSQTDPLGLTTNFTYDAHNNLTSYTDAKGNTTSYAYSSANDLLSITYANGTEQGYSYNPLGEATQYLNALGHAIGYTYNAQGLVATQTFADGTSYSYTYNPQGNLTSATDGQGNVTTFLYGNPNNPDLLTEVDYPDGTWLKFAYNIVGQRTQSVDQTGFTVNYGYDALGRLSQLTDGRGNLVVKYTYDDAGNLVQKDMGNGTRTVYTYDKDGAVLSITNYAPDHITVNSFDDYTYDALGNALTDTNQDGEWVYSYDADSQLVQAVFTPNSTDPDGLIAQDLQYVYDAAGNRISETANGVTTTYVTNNMNEYTSSTTSGVTTSYRYDSGGNLIAQVVGGSTTTYTFNELNELTAVNGPSITASYGYTPLGSLFSQTVNGATTNYQVDPTALGNVVATFDGSGNLMAHYTYGLGLASRVNASGAACYYDFDLLGSTVGITNSQGKYVNEYGYDPFGQVTTIRTSIANPFTFVGQFGVTSGGDDLMTMGLRTYESLNGQFLSIDPLGLDGGDTNTRRYVNNNPVTFVDPLGLQGLPPVNPQQNGKKADDAYSNWQQQQPWNKQPDQPPPNQIPPPPYQAPPGSIWQWVPPGSPQVDCNGKTTYSQKGRWILVPLNAKTSGDPPNDPSGTDPCPCKCPPPKPPPPPGGPCTLVIPGSYFYICLNNHVYSGFVAGMSIPERDCSAKAVAGELGGILVVGGAVPPGILSLENCNPLINTTLQQNQQTSKDASDPPVDTAPPVAGTDRAANGAGPPGNRSPLAFIATVLGNLGLINGQSGNDGYPPAEAAQMVSTIATFDQVQSDLAGIFATTSGPGASLGIEGDIALLHQVDARLGAVTGAENLLFGGDANWLNTNQSATLQQWMTAFFTAAESSSDGLGTITAAEETQLLATTLPSSVPTSEAQEFIDRWNRTVQYWSQGIFTAAQVAAGRSTDFLDLGAIQTAFNAAVTAEQFSQVNGYSDVGAEVQGALKQVQSDLEGQGVCATVKLQIDQTATLTRSAFSGTLTITNSEGTGAMTNVVMDITITDVQGNPANGKFFISSPTYSGAFNVVNGVATLPDYSTGTIAFTFIPDDSAAPSAPTQYQIGGTIGFTDPAGGAVTIPVFPATITVNPQPELQLNYFLQRDVIGPDPFTPNVVIPSEPAVLGLLVTNVGGGTANNLAITTAQPQILQNAKGLLVTFQIIGTQVGNQQETPSLTVSFGNIAPGQTGDASFLILSSLEGLFENFTATFSHSNALGGTATSLIKSVQTHDLVHAGDFNDPNSTGATDYLVDDNPNPQNLPDTIYFSNGTTDAVNVATDATSSPVGPSSALTFQVTANVTSGWDYIQLPDPGAGYTLYRVVRSDGTVIPISDQAWTTDRTISPTGRSTVDYELHMLDLNSTGSYTVEYRPTSATAPTVASISSVSSPQNGSVGSVDVVFSEAIDPSTFTTSNLLLTLNGGGNLINSGVTITPDSPTTFTIGGLAPITGADGNYTLSVDPTDVSDFFGDVGNSAGAASTEWATGTNVPVVVSVGAGNPALRNTPVDSVDVVLSEPIESSSFDYQALSLTLNGGPNLITPGVTVTQVNPTTYSIGGLGSLAAVDGNYELTVSAGGLVDGLGNSGVGLLSENWTMNTVGPTVASLPTYIQSPRNIVVPTIDVIFSEPIIPATFTAQDITYSKPGGPNLILPSITITQLSPTEFAISNFNNFLLPIDGTYTLTVSAAGVEDFAGNTGTGSASDTWVLDTTAPAAPTDLAISPNTGATPGLTDTGSVTLTGTLAESGLAVDVMDGNTDLGYANVTGTSFSIALNLPTGANQLVATASDPAGNVSPSTTFSVFVDASPLHITSVVGPSPNPRNTPVGSVDVTFTEPIDLATFTSADLTLTDNGSASLITSAVTISLVSGSTYQIGGLAGLTSAEGSYTLTIGTAGVMDSAGNVGTGSVTTTWLMDMTPPTSAVSVQRAQTTSTSFLVSATGTDPSGSNGSTPSGIKSFALYVSTDGGAFRMFATVTPYAQSAVFAGQAGHTYGFYSVATDNAGNVQPTPSSAQATVQVLAPLSVTSIAAAAPNPRNTPVSTVDVTLSQPINLSSFTDFALTLTDNGGPNLITSSVTMSLVSASTYQIGGLAGLTGAEGTYVLTVDAAELNDDYGNPGSGTLSTSWLMDTTPPTSTVNALPAVETSTSFTVSVTGGDPTGSNGSPPSGIAFFTLYVSKDGGPFTEFAAVTPANPSTVFTGQPGQTYGFYTVATDNAGNVQPTPASAQATTMVVSPLTITAIAAVSPNPRNTAVTAIDVTFSEPINTSSLSPGALTLTDNGGANLLSGGVTLTLVSGDTYAIGGLAALTAAQGNYVLTVDAADIDDTYGNSGTGTASTSWLMDTTPPTSHVINSLGATQTSDSFPVSVTFSDPTSAGAPASGVSSVDLYVSVNNGPFSLYQTQSFAPTASGTLTFAFVGQDRNLYAFHSIAHDAAGNTENKSSTAIEASTSVPDLHPPVTHILASSPSYSWAPFPSPEFSGLAPSSYSNGVFTINWAGADPDANTGVPAGSISLVNLYVQVDGGAPVLIGQPTGGAPNGNGVYSGSITYNALADGLSHTYSFYSVGVDDQQVKQYAPQAGPAAADVTFTETYTAPLAVQNLVVEKNIAERSFIRYLDVNFNQTAATSPALQSLAAGLAGSSPNSFVELEWYGENLTASSGPQGGVNLFNAGTTASVSLTGNDLSINFGPSGITSLLTETGVKGTGSPTSSFGDGWYALGIDPNGNPSKGQVFWEPFFRLLGSATGDLTVTGPYTAAGTDAYVVYHAEGQSGPLLNADVNGDGTVNSKDLTETVGAKGHAVGASPPANFPQFQLFAGPEGRAGAVTVAVTQTQVQALLPEAIAAWRAAGLDPADLRRLEGAQVQVGNLGRSILGLEAAGVITINQTAAGNNWYVNASAGSSHAFGLVGPGGEEIAGPGSPAAGEVDLLTVLEHELGHVVGLSDNGQAGDLMDITLGVGVRRAPASADLATIARAASSAATVQAAPATVTGLTGDRYLVGEKRNEIGSTNVSGSVSVPSAAVDAALASISTSSATAGNDEVQGLIEGGGSPPPFVVRLSAIAVKSGRKDRRPRSGLAYRHLPSSLFPQVIRRPGAAAGSDLKPLGRDRENG